jgi:septal ring factor EnvC (AmiA/AmiB activator)
MNLRSDIQVRRIKIEVQIQIKRKEDHKAQLQACIASSKKRIDELDTKLSDLHKEIEKNILKIKGICYKFDYIKEF